ncbi:MAG: ATP synthase F1 subunit gamma [Acidimicrobiales bacterium]
MPAGQERTLRRRIRSVQSTQKITRAMELIAASRIIRAQQAIAAARPYTERMRDVVAEVAATPEARGHWMFSGGGERSVVVVLGADRGLSGAFNLSVLRAADELLRELSSRGPDPAVVAVGRKAVSYFNFRRRALAARLESIADRPRFEHAQQVVAAITEQVESRQVGQIYLVSTRFSSIGSQRAQSSRLVPLERGERESTAAFEFEPGPSEILDRLLPRWLEAEIYLALLESAASFHVAQQRAMKSATDNADELIKTLRRAMNRARQDAITTEIMEIVGGAEALRQSEDREPAAGTDVYAFPEAS